jgi:four helix bundle protein
MAGERNPENLFAWQLCEELGDQIVAITATGPSSRDFDFCDQLRRAANAPGPHIAEGFGRFTPREFARYLRMAVSSLMETRTFLLRGGRRGYWPTEIYERTLALCDRAMEVTRKLLASKLRQIKAEDVHRRSRRRART